MLNNLGALFKTYLIVVNNWIWKNKNFEENKILFMIIEKEESRIMTEQKTSANFALTKFYYLQLLERGKKE